MSEATKELISYEEAVQMVRAAIEDRATWFHLLTKEMAAKGVDAESIARVAVREFGCLKSHKMAPTSSMAEFVKQFANKVVQHVFEMNVVEQSEEKAVIQFHYCPLVESWKKLGCAPERVDALCQWAVEGDFGVMSNFPDFAFDPQQRIAEGKPYCRMVFTRKH